ncbi:hypothetical protein UPF0102 [Clostridium pasteurianum DSM 525 = ATCC 6013]|uniref:UPF0102 protein CLPA_c20550 n=1 Tax=Clostridium pasteurianum DSM 525 = ATCC 6013 TaxID=1262449 RepID=A0A0H3J9Z9_CLOPA|nr:YraN family protein [Clostridium pasteurianum]AJA48125.1 hypothetical protein UPF0102 [Clostridium pasteurianum DSM 525 = ATCC 6013]AJA52113.1 hypothetical protein UPF0102 [Clostridium pasteurianum DSM 525 = ATCC 6013]AOZ75392.1 hypothetical protein AQ983_09975 [Clostridium pasteurianum DSM 525 = ATCC 6013]AOZ79187.1 hypothetical protein AQ984_09965 [Clostridium pasteurianum]ELP60722.1 hypothetical protein F502_04517 [Clostridium pasteurianum DSM 525 = ATCC 6013]
MGRYNKEIGNYGENEAVQYLQDLNYEIIERNFKCKMGEIDIIAKYKETLCFIEVKTRYATNYGFPAEAVDRRKQFKIYKISELYIIKNKISDLNFRFDVIEVLLNSKNNRFSLRLIENAFQI